MDRPFVSINILNYNTFEKSKVCIESCLDQDYENYQILLVDNCSTDESFNRLSELYGEKVICYKTDENYGYAKGNNIGVSLCSEKGIKYSLLLNSDTELVGKDFVSKLMNVALTSEKCAMVSPTIYDVTQKGLSFHKNESQYLKCLRMGRVIPNNKSFSEKLKRLSEAHGSALLVDNEIFLSVGGFPEHYFMYGEESTLAKKILWSGNYIYGVFDKDSYVLHHHDKSTHIEPWRRFLMGRNRGLEFWENRKGHHKYVWTLIFKLFKLQYRWLSYVHHNRSYLDGICSAKDLYLSGASKQECYEKAKKIRSEYYVKE